MIICWDNLENLRYNKNTGKWYKGRRAYVYKNSCKTCKNSYLTRYDKQGDFCSNICINKGRRHTEEFKNKISEVTKGKNNPFYGKKHNKITKEKWSENRKGVKRKFSKEHKINLSKSLIGRKGHLGKNHPNWKGGVTKKNVPLYDTYAYQIEYAEEVKNIDNILQIRCAYCGKWYIPKYTDVVKRINALNGRGVNGEARFYCSTSCKKECPIFNQKLYPKGYKKATSREVQPELRQLVFERDNWTCQKCGSTKSLHCHHVEGIRWEPLESADIDKCITYCKICHKEVHKIEECKTVDMQCKEKYETK